MSSSLFDFPVEDAMLNGLSGPLDNATELRLWNKVCDSEPTDDIAPLIANKQKIQHDLNLLVAEVIRIGLYIIQDTSSRTAEGCTWT